MEVLDGLGNQNFEQVQAEILFGNSNFVALGQFTFCAIISFAFIHYVEIEKVLLWDVFVLLPIFYRVYINYRYTHRTAVPGILWSRLYASASLVSGLAWGSMVLLDVGFLHFYLIAIVGLGMATSSMMTSAVYKTASILFMTPILVSVIAYSYFNSDPRFVSFFFLTTVYSFFLYIFMLRTNKSITESINLRFENDFLLKEITREKDAALQATKKAESANLSKSKFLASASHDLRQPLHALGLFFDALQSTESKSERDKIYPSMGNSITSLNELLNALLDISKLDAGAIEINNIPLSLRGVIDRIVDEYGPQLSEKGIELRSRVSDVAVFTDPIWLDRILRNLVSNSVRYTDTGKVLISVRTRNEKILLQVWDTGIGIKPESIDIIFDEFQQLQNPQRDRSQGLGLGLAIVKRLCRILGFEISVRSEYQRGTVFSITMPIYDYAITGSMKDEIKPKVSLEGRKILLIDDEAEVHVAMKLVLEKWGCEVRSAEDFVSSMKVLEAFDPDVIVSDYRLANNMTGVDVLKKINKQLNKNIPSVLVTGETSPDTIRKIGCGGYKMLHKPVKAVKLRLMLNEACNEIT